MAYNKAQVTDAGNALFAQILANKSSLSIDKIEISNVQLAVSTVITSMTKIDNVVQTTNANGLQKSGNSFIISTAVSNASVTADYQAWVFGIWGSDSANGTSTLIEVITTTGTPDTIPAYSGSTPVTYNYKFATALSNASSINLSMSNDAYATNDTVLHTSGDETSTGTKTFEKIEVSNDSTPDVVLTDGASISLDNGESKFTPANNSTVVHNSGDETIDGKKKFDTDPTDGAGNAYAKTVDVNQQLDKKVNIADMRKPASDVAGIEEVSAKQDKIGYTPADDSKVVHDNHDGTISINGDSFTPAALDSPAGVNAQPIDTDVDTLVKPGLYYVSGSAPNNPFKGRMMLETRVQYDWSTFKGFQTAYAIDGRPRIAVRVVYPNSDLTTAYVPNPWVLLSDDSKVAHLSGANNFDTVPTVDDSPLLLASSLPSDLARTSQQTNFTAGLQSNGQDVLTVKTPGIPKLAVNYNTTSKAFDYTLTAPEKDGFSDILQYNLLWKDHSVDDWTAVIVKPDGLTGQLTGVDITKTYDFKAAAQNVVGSSGYTDVVTLGAVDGNIYGVSWDGSSSGALQRTDAAVGLKAGINGAQNDFDTRGPWGLMDKTVTDSYGNAFVRVPKFYIRKTQDKNKPLSTWQVSLVKQGDDWYLPNCFYDFDTKKELDYVDVSRYEGFVESGRLKSKSGVNPTSSLDINDFRTAATALNADGKKGYHLWDVHTLDTLQVLFTIEFATLDSQSIMEGNDSGSSAISNGTTDNVKGSSGFAASGAAPMTYRGIENLYGNLAMWTDGLNVSNLSLYSCDDATKYVSNIFTNPYYQVSYPLISAAGKNITGLGFDKEHPGVTAPTSFNSDSYNTYYHDDGYVNDSGNYVVDTGGSWNWNAGTSGLWWWFGNISSSYAGSDIGSRLLKKAL